MKTTRYFDHVRQRPDRKNIKDEWILKAVKEPIAKEVQTDGRIRCWCEIEGRFLRVVLLEDKQTVHNAFFDRNFKRKVQ